MANWEMDRGQGFLPKHSSGVESYNTPTNQMGPSYGYDALNEAIGAPGVAPNMGSEQNILKALQQINSNKLQQLNPEEIDAINRKRNLQQNRDPLADLRLRLQGMQYKDRPLQPPLMDRRVPEEMGRQRLLGPGAILDFFNRIKNYR
jgi:hypothetical protein